MTAPVDFRARDTVEWPTWGLLVLTYAVWGWATAGDVPALLGAVLVALAAAMHSSLSHEALHGHPTQNAGVNAALVFPALTLCIPYGRFRDSHLAHHHDEILTDPYDDPETNYLDPAVWAGLSRPWQAVLRFNNTLAGRLLVGPAVGMTAFIGADLRAIRSGDRAVARDWLVHVPALAVVILWWLMLGTLPLWALLLGSYAALSLLKIRTFLEHRADDRASARTVVVEDRGWLSLLFLNNNFHMVHHMHPCVAWYRLPALYASRRADYLRRNGGYLYASYAAVFRQYFLRAKDVVPHPLSPRGGWPRR